MSNEGQIEPVPLKVVPMYLENPTTPVPTPPVEEQSAPLRAPGRTHAWLGLLAIALAVIAGVVHVRAVGVSMAGDTGWGTVLGYLAIAVSVAAVLGGVLAVLLRRGRRAGVVAVVLGCAANPLIVLAVLRFLGGGQV
ncbi:MAG: hypothetical protein ACRCSP_06530 [Rhodoglobus sp.]